MRCGIIRASFHPLVQVRAPSCGCPSIPATWQLHHAVPSRQIAYALCRDEGDYAAQCVAVSGPVRVDALWPDEADTASPTCSDSPPEQAASGVEQAAAARSRLTGAAADVKQPSTSAGQVGHARVAASEDAWPIGGLQSEQAAAKGQRGGVSNLSRQGGSAHGNGDAGRRSRRAPVSKKAARKLAVQQTRVQRAFESALDPEGVAETIRWLRDGSMKSPARLFLSGRRGVKAASKWVRDVAARFHVAVSSHAATQQAKGQWLQLARLASEPRPLSAQEDAELRLLVRGADSGATCPSEVLCTAAKVAPRRARRSGGSDTHCPADAAPLEFVAGEVLGSRITVASEAGSDAERADRASDKAPTEMASAPPQPPADAVGNLPISRLQIAADASLKIHAATAPAMPPEAARANNTGMDDRDAEAGAAGTSAEVDFDSLEPARSTSGPLFELEVPGFALGQAGRERSAASPKMQVRFNKHLSCARVLLCRCALSRISHAAAHRACIRHHGALVWGQSSARGRSGDSRRCGIEHHVHSARCGRRATRGGSA